MRFNLNVFHLLFGLSCSIAHAGQVTKAEWLAAMPSALSNYFCQPDQYFRQCFDVTAPRCQEVVESASVECLTNYQNDIPEVLNQPRDGTHWGQVVGRCVGQSYELSLTSVRLSNRRCNDPSNWQ